MRQGATKAISHGVVFIGTILGAEWPSAASAIGKRRHHGPPRGLRPEINIRWDLGVAKGSATFRDLRYCQRQEKPRVWQTTSPALRILRENCDRAAWRAPRTSPNDRTLADPPG